MQEFVLKVPDIDAESGGKSYAFDVAPRWVEQALQRSELRVDPNAGTGSLRVHAQRSGAEILVQGTLETRVLTDCSRCLGDAAVPVDVRVFTLMAEQPEVPGIEAEELELKAEDVERDYFSGEHIVLDDLVRQYILLECPMQPLCATDCEGIDIPEHVRPPAEPLTSDGKAVDPRLAPLAELARELPNKDVED